MQTGRGSRDGSRFFCEYSLVALAIGILILALDVRRKRDMAQALHVFLCHIFIAARKLHSAKSKVTARKNFGFEFSLAEDDSLTYGQFPARPDKRFPNVARHLPREKDFDNPAKMLLGGRTRRRLGVNARTFSE
jgi:hypothetical protein